jgi:transcriptional regulator with XRE-family HTH domain
VSGSLALKLRVLRAERALTIEQAAEKAGVTPETISDAERGRRHPYLPTLRKIAQGYGVPIEELLAREAEEPALAGAPGKDRASTTRQPEDKGSAVPRFPQLQLAVLSREDFERKLFGVPVTEGEEPAPLLTVEAADRLVHDVRAERDDLENWLKAYAGAPSEEKMRARLDKSRAEASLAWARLYYLVLLDYWSKLADPRDVPFKGVGQIVSESEEAQGLMRAIKRYQDELRRFAAGRAG